MLDKNGFDLWANGYDKTVELYEGKNDYPFAGYKNLLEKVYNILIKENSKKVLAIYTMLW